MRRKDPDFVFGKEGSYRIQPPIVHPANCTCSRCAALPIPDRGESHVFRINRASKAPNSRVQSAAYALQVKAQLEEELRRSASGRGSSAKLDLSSVLKLMLDVNPNRVSQATLTRDGISARNVCRVVADLAPDVLPEDIDEPIAVRYRNTREREGAAPRTILNELVLLRRVLGFGLRWQRETGMATLSLHATPEVGDTASKKTALSISELKKVLEVADERERLLLCVGVSTMLRRTPLLAFRKSWVDSDQRWLSVPAELMKKGRSRRRKPLEVPLCATTAQLIANAGTADDDLLFGSSKKSGQPITWVEDIFEGLSKRAGVRHFSPHILRRTGNSLLRERGVDEMLVSVLMGHAGVFNHLSGAFEFGGSASTTRIYTTVFAEPLRRAVSVFDELLGHLVVTKPSISDERPDLSPGSITKET